jgi:hypothetical protein
MTGWVVMVLRALVVVRRDRLYILGGTISAGGKYVKEHFIAVSLESNPLRRGVQRLNRKERQDR